MAVAGLLDYWGCVAAPHGLYGHAVGGLDHGGGHPSGLGTRYKYRRPEDGLVLTEPYYICILFIYLYAILRAY
jgi:hypothetical protein